MVKNLRACKKCKALTEKLRCERCDAKTTKEWSGFLIILEPANSEIAKKLDIDYKGEFALKVS